MVFIKAIFHIGLIPPNTEPAASTSNGHVFGTYIAGINTGMETIISSYQQTKKDQ